jgi:Na+-transporting NADH:ubiquinone oxidoreductase subunit B
MKAWWLKCRGAWRSGPGIPVQFLHTACPVAPGLRSRHNLAGVHARVALAALPILPAWVWNAGWQIRSAVGQLGLEDLPGWRGVLLPAGTAAPEWQFGLACFLPLLVASLASVIVVETLYAVLRGRRVEAGWYLPAWLFALLLPAGVELPQAMAAIGLGVLLGKLVFGGAGKTLLSPVLLGALLLQAGHPESFSAVPASWVPPPAAGVSTWLMLVDGGPAAGGTWWLAFLGREVTGFGASSALACLAAGTYLAAAGVVSWRTLAGGLLGLALVSAGLALADGSKSVFTIPWYWHASLGGFAFGLAFLAADPGAAPLTTAGRWFLGLAAGALTMLIRSLDPTHPDGSLHAILLAALFAPLADEWVSRRAVSRRRRREEAWP